MPLRICFIASEVAPLAKTGGLADVAGALTKYLHAAGHDVRLFMPLYRQIDRAQPEPLAGGIPADVPVQLGAHTLRFSSAVPRACPARNAMVYLVDAPALFARDCHLQHCAGRTPALPAADPCGAAVLPAHGVLAADPPLQ